MIVKLYKSFFNNPQNKVFSKYSETVKKIEEYSNTDLKEHHPRLHTLIEKLPGILSALADNTLTRMMRSDIPYIRQELFKMKKTLTKKLEVLESKLQESSHRITDLLTSIKKEMTEIVSPLPFKIDVSSRFTNVSS